MRSNPMDNKVNVASVAHGTGLYQYFIKLVPTLYEKASASSSRSSASDLEDGGNIWTNQYSFTERFRPLAEHMGGPHLEAAMQDHHAHGTSKHQPMATTVLPGVFWVYDLSAFMLQVSGDGLWACGAFFSSVVYKCGGFDMHAHYFCVVIAHRREEDKEMSSTYLIYHVLILCCYDLLLLLIARAQIFTTDQASAHPV